MKLIHNWKELSKVKPSKTHYIKVDEDMCCAHVYENETDEFVVYLSTHSFYGSQYEYTSKILQTYGFNIELDNWDKSDK